MATDAKVKKAEPGNLDSQVDALIAAIRALAQDYKRAEAELERMRLLLALCLREVCTDCANGNRAYQKHGRWIHSGTEMGAWSGERKGFQRDCTMPAELRAEAERAERMRRKLDEIIAEPEPRLLHDAGNDGGLWHRQRQNWRNRQAVAAELRSALNGKEGKNV